jgi:hypothetical protein
MHLLLHSFVLDLSPRDAFCPPTFGISLLTFWTIPLVPVVLLLIYLLGHFAPQLTKVLAHLAAQLTKEFTANPPPWPLDSIFDPYRPFRPIAQPIEVPIFLAFGSAFFFPVLVALLCAFILTNQRNNLRFPFRGLPKKILFVSVPSCLVLAFPLGRFYEPVRIKLDVTSKVIAETDKDRTAEVDGKIIFYLNRAIVLLNAEGTTLIVIPQEKI